MTWQTLVDIEKPDFLLDYHSRFMLLGSCFAEIATLAGLSIIPSRWHRCWNA